MFNDVEKRIKLNKMTHWRVFKAMFKQMFYHRVIKGSNKVVLDVPLLFETKVLEHFCCPIITVCIQDEQVQLDRLLKRNPELSHEEAIKRI